MGIVSRISGIKDIIEVIGLRRCVVAGIIVGLVVQCSYNIIDSRYTSTSRDTSRYNRYGSRYNSYNTCIYIYHLV